MKGQRLTGQYPSNEGLDAHEYIFGYKEASCVVVILRLGLLLPEGWMLKSSAEGVALCHGVAEGGNYSEGQECCFYGVATENKEEIEAIEQDVSMLNLINATHVINCLRTVMVWETYQWQTFGRILKDCENICRGVLALAWRASCAKSVRKSLH